MANDGSGAAKIANAVNTSYCPIAAYRPDPECVLFVSGSNFYRINGSTGAITQIHSEPRNYVGEVAINTSGTRMAGRGSDSNLYRITVGGSSSQYATTCSSSVSPNGSYLTANVSGHTKLTIYNWSGSVYRTLNAPSSHEWDNQRFSVNSSDYVVYNYDTAGRIGMNQVSTDTNTAICNMWSSYPDLFIGSLPGAPTPNEAPTASISSPANGTSYSPGDTISYSGSATDPEDGALGGASLYWELDRIGDGQGPVKT